MPRHAGRLHSSAARNRSPRRTDASQRPPRARPQLLPAAPRGKSRRGRGGCAAAACPPPSAAAWEPTLRLASSPRVLSIQGKHPELADRQWCKFSSAASQQPAIWSELINCDWLVLANSNLIIRLRRGGSKELIDCGPNALPYEQAFSFLIRLKKDRRQA